MSSGGQVIGGIVGGVIGFFVGGPVGALRGAQLGIMAGGLIDPPKGPTINGPRLEDLNVQTSTYGAFIPRNYGTVAQSGNVFWIQGDAITEVQTTTTSGGKGGPEQTTNTWSYYATFAVGLCKGPIDGVRRIWIGGQLWYDAGSDDLSTIIASNQNADLFTLYLGTDTQTADPLIQADKGVSNVPAYRGLAYIVFETLPLEKYGNSLMGAQVKVEIAKTASNGMYTTDVVMPSVDWGAVCWNGSIFVAVQDGGTNAALSYDGQNWISTSIGSGNWRSVAYGDGVFCAVSATGSTGNVAVSSNGVTWATSPMASPNSWEGIAWNGIVFCAVASNTSYGAASAVSVDGINWTAYAMPVAATWTEIIWNGTVFCAISNGAYSATSPDGVTWTAGSMPYSQDWVSLAWDGSQFCAVSNNGASSAISSDGLSWTVGGALPSSSDWASVAWNGVEFLAVNDSLYSVGATSPDGATWTSATLPSKRWVSVVDMDGVFFAVADVAPGGAIIYRKISSGTTTLGDIVEDECLTSKILTAGDLDVTELTDVVRGYRVSQIGAIRGAIDPLRAAWPFDVVQHGYQILFKRRGSASVATIPSTLLDARAAGESPGVQITDSREMDLMLPRRVDVQYLDSVREYDVNEQMSPERTSTDTAGIRKLDLPIVFSGAEAAQTAETLLYLYWLERYDVVLRLPPEYSELEPGDVITVTSDTADYELRLTSINTLPDGRMECAAKYNKAAIYTPVARGEEGQSTGGTLTLGGASVYSLLDIPLLRDDDDTAGFPVAMEGYLSGWPGGVLYRSDDGGQTWADLRAFAPGAVIGYATGTLAAHGGTVIDFSSRLTVNLYSGTLASVTQAQMFAGQNWFAYGAHGRWEIIAAATAVLQGDGSYILSDLLRGQRGTEWATGLHSSNDRIVLLDANAMSFISVNSSTIGTARDYRGITTGKALSSDSSLSFTYTAVNLECLSPVHLTGSRHPSTNDWTLTWTRRSRYDQWRDYVDAPLGETSESYEVDVYSDGTYATVVRTITASSATAAYTSAQQVTDFGSNQATLYLKVYQLSATVGRGYALTQSITR